MSEYIVKQIDAVLYHGDRVEQIKVKDCKVKITQPRNVKHHRMVFAALSHTVLNMRHRDGIDSAERLLLAYKDYAGMFDIIPKSKGEPIRDYHSISFASMDESSFKPIAEGIKDFCCLVLNDKPRHVTDKLIEILIGNN